MSRRQGNAPMIRYRCPRCEKPLAAQDEEAGAKLGCRHCGQRVQVPALPAREKTMLGEPDEERSSRTVLGSREPDGPDRYPPPPRAKEAPPPPPNPFDFDAPQRDDRERREGPDRRRVRDYEDDDEYDRSRRRHDDDEDD